MRRSTSWSRNGARFSHSTASSIEETCQIQNPPMISLASANGPSVTRDPAVGLERQPLALRRRLEPLAGQQNSRP